MITLSNSLSCCRAPLVFLFFFDNVNIRLLAIFLAALTDCVDGYLARRYQSTSKLGTILDPAMDKFFVYVVLFVFYREGNISSCEVVAMLSRDFFLCFYGIFMVVLRRWKTIFFRSVRWGKVTTALQFAVLSGLTCHVSLHWAAFASFIIMGWLAFLELFQFAEKVDTE